MAFDIDLLQKCADPSLTPAIVEQFMKAAGSTDPLAVTVHRGKRVILVPPAKTPEEALELVRRHVGQAVVRVGVTQYPVRVGITDASELKLHLVDACENIRMGTALFGKVWRVVLKWYGNPTDESILPHVLEDAVEAWRTGQFEGTAVFSAPDPGEPKPTESWRKDPRPGSAPARKLSQDAPPTDPHKADIRIDLSEIGGRRTKTD